jgi:hypothetical protein
MLLRVLRLSAKAVLEALKNNSSTPTLIALLSVIYNALLV